MVMQGSCWLIPRRSDPIPLSVGDVVLLYGNQGHGLADSPDTPLSEIAGPGEPQLIEGPGPRTTLLCGVYEFEQDWSHPMLDALPEVVHVPARLGRHPRLRATVDLLTAELEERGPGTNAVAPALLDTELAATLGAIHDAPEREWTVEALASHAGMSRATFARRFTAGVGEPPLAYLTRWRMITAARRLRESDAPLSVIAKQVGYGSEYAFAKAFKRVHGTAPGQYRRRGTAPSIAE
jgi:AraC-like DNA-binding protein